jgi:predicted CoA-binding protein
MNRSVAVVGASPDRRKFGNKAVRAYLAAGYDVFPVHPTEPTVEGLPTYKSVADIPRDRLDRVALYVPPKVGLLVLEGLVGRAVGQVILNPGADAPEVVTRAKELGLPAVQGCAIIMVGSTPQDFADE